MRQITNPFFWWPVLCASLCCLNVLARHIDCNGHFFLSLAQCILRYDYGYMNGCNENLGFETDSMNGKNRRKCDKPYGNTARSTHRSNHLPKLQRAIFYFIYLYQLSLSNCDVHDVVADIWWGIRWLWLAESLFIFTLFILLNVNWVTNGKYAFKSSHNCTAIKSHRWHMYICRYMRGKERKRRRMLIARNWILSGANNTDNEHSHYMRFDANHR